MLAHHPECLARDPVRVRHREHEVAVLRLGRAPETGELGRGKELRDLRADLLAGQRELREPLGTLALRAGGPVVDLLPCRVRLARDDHSAHRAAAREWLAERVEGRRREDLGEVDELHPETEVRPPLSGICHHNQGFRPCRAVAI